VRHCHDPAVHHGGERQGLCKRRQGVTGIGFTGEVLAAELLERLEVSLAVLETLFPQGAQGTLVSRWRPDDQPALVNPGIGDT
jgi:hypothetical protein